MTPKLVDHRTETLRLLAREPVDLLVIGGGIVGAGIARDAAMRGLRTVLVEQHDFAFGTSSRSSRLLHGGIRYLSQGRLGLVREACREKRTLFSIAPHLADPLPFLFPAYEKSGWPLWQLRIGVKIYDLFSGAPASMASSVLSAEQTLDAVPGLKSDRLKGAARYFDAFTQDARLVLDTLRSARAHGAMPLNYVEFLNARLDSGQWHCGIRDGLTRERSNLRARAVVNATGPWSKDLPNSRVRLRLTKGIHVVFERTRLPVSSAVVITEGKRILFVLPWGERVITGTTDTDYSGPLDSVHADASDVAYLLAVLNQFFPRSGLAARDVRSTWAGLRPLIAGSKTVPRDRPSDISRRHQIQNPEPFWWDVTGGKLTTYRLMAEQTIDQIASKLGLRASCSRTAQVPLLPPEAVRFSGTVPPPLSKEAVEHFCAEEWAVHLDDVMIRRTSWEHYLDTPATASEEVSHWMADILDWTEDVRAAELERHLRLRGTKPPDL